MKNKTLLLVGLGSSLLIGGGLFWYYRNRKKANDAKMEDDYKYQTENINPEFNTLPSSSSTKPSSTWSKSETLAFQKWHNNKGYTPKLVEDGIYGSKTDAAFKKYGQAYKSGSTQKTTETKKSNLLYLKGDSTSIYKFPEFKGEYIIGTVNKSFFLDKPFGKAVSETGTGWIKFETFAFLPKCAPNVRCTTVVKKETAYIRKEFTSDKPF
jgi:peptidoglycan hydrolase-like protein with peptidoglycan-binding domain